MIAGIMQPYFFPYIGYFDLIFRSDVWVVFDIAQFQPKSWMYRNRMLHPTKGWQYISVTLSGKSQNMCICDVFLSDPFADCQKIIRQLEHYKKRAPFYSNVISLVHEAFSRATSKKLVDLNVACLAAVCEHLKIEFQPVVASTEQFPLAEIQHPGQWALEISACLGADTYINPPNGRPLFRPQEFHERGIHLAFTELSKVVYDCTPYTFEPHLSILDVLMWNSPDQIRNYLRQSELTFEA